MTHTAEQVQAATATRPRLIPAVSVRSAATGGSHGKTLTATAKPAMRTSATGGTTNSAATAPSPAATVAAAHHATRRATVGVIGR